MAGAKRGPPPTPTEILDIRASWRGSKNPKRKKDATPDPTRPEKPARLSEAAALVWDELADKLHSAGLLTSADGRAFARLCQMHADYDEAQAWMDEPGHGQWMAGYDKGGDRIWTMNPQRKICDILAAAILRLEQQFGMTPSARAGLPVTPAGKPVDEKEARKRRLLGGG